jgi:hypothetical protein
MLDIYKKMEAEGKIGKFFKDTDGSLKARPFMEFPKTIRVQRPDGTIMEKVVHSAREEIAAQSFESAAAEVDPVVKERNELLEMVAERDAKAQVKDQEMAQMRAELDEMRKLLMSRPVAKAEAEGDE